MCARPAQYSAALESRQHNFVCWLRLKVGNTLLPPATQYTSKFDIFSMFCLSLTFSLSCFLCVSLSLSLFLPCFAYISLSVCIMWSLCTSLGPVCCGLLRPGQRHRPLTFIFMANAKRQRHLLNFLCLRKFTFMFCRC